MPVQTTAAGVSIARRRDHLISALPGAAVAAASAPSVRHIEVISLPAPLPAVSSSGSSSGTFASARVDDHARLKDAKVFRGLGWEPGMNLSVSVGQDGRVSLSLSMAPASSCLTLDERGRLVLSVAVREVLGAVPGASVLIVPTSVPGTAVLVGPDALLRALGGPHVAA